MHIQKMIKKIVDDGEQEKMEELSNILEEAVNVIKKYDEDCYKQYCLKLYKMAYGDELTEEMATELVKEMQPYGMRWNIQETEKMQRERGLNDISVPDFFYSVNQAYNDYRNVFGDNLEMYVRYADAFICDEDARRDKVLAYGILIPR